MEEEERPNLQNKLADIRATLQRLGTSMTEDDLTEENKSDDPSYENKYQLYDSPSERNQMFEEWNYEEQYSKDSKRSQVEDTELKQINLKLVELQVNEDNLRKRLHEKEAELISAKSANCDIQNKAKALTEVINKKDREIHKLVYENELLSTKAKEAESAIKEIKLHEADLMKENQDLQDSLELLESENFHLKDSLHEYTTLVDRLSKTLKLKEDAISNLHQSKKSLEKEIGTLSQKNFFTEESRKDIKRLKTLENSSPERFEYNLTERAEDAPYKLMCSEAMKIIGVGSSKDFYSKLLHLRQYHSKYKKNRKLIERISDMIVQCSPSGSFPKEPNSHQIWKWITGLVEEYMKLKKSINGEALGKLCEMMKTDDIDSVVSKVAQLVKLRA